MARAILFEESFQPQEAISLAELHQAAFPNFFLSELGTQFLKQFYLGFIGDPTAIVVIARAPEGTVHGIAVGTVEPRGFFRRLLLGRWPGFVWASLCAAVRNPRVIPRLLSAVAYRGDTPSTTSGALLSSICVSPDSQGQGLGRALVQEWGHQAFTKGQTVAHLTTDALGNDSVNRLYVKAGWALEREFLTRQGRRMNLYVRQLAPRSGPGERGGA